MDELKASGKPFQISKMEVWGPLMEPWGSAKPARRASDDAPSGLDRTALGADARNGAQFLS